MSTAPLPRSLDIRKAAVRGVTLSGTLASRDLPRFQSMLADQDATIQVDLSFGKDEERRPVVGLALTASVAVICQRCLQPMPLELGGSSRLGIVWTDEQARHLPRDLDPLLVGEEGCNLWELVEEELILLMPQFNYHDTENCKQRLSEYTGARPDEEPGAKAPNPFEVLAQLKSDK